MENSDKIVEAIIFASGTAISKADLLEKLPELSPSKLNSIIADIKKRFSGDEAIILAEFNGKVQFMSNPKYGEEVATVLTPLKEKELTKTLLEVLATVAYKQPITRLEIDDLRGGTSSEYAITALLKAGLIEPVGRKDVVGRPILYGTTDEFLKKFQLESINDLPDYQSVLENLRLIQGENQATLFHTRTIMTDDDQIFEQEMIADAMGDGSEDSQEEEEIPDFLKDENVEIFD